MDIEPLAIEGVLLVRTRRIADARGSLTESWSERAFAAAGIAMTVRQENQSFSHRAGTLRGLHAQRPPHGQAKLVRVLQGAAWDVALDLRQGSALYGRHVAVTLSAESGEQLYIPAGFAHGFVTLTDATILAYRLSALHEPAAEVGIAWDDPDLRIGWPLDGRAPILSDRDRALPHLAASGLVL